MKVCIFWGRDKLQPVWNNLLSAYGIVSDDIYIIVLEGFDSKIPLEGQGVGSANILKSAEMLPPGPLVVASPQEANSLPGKTSLHDLVHPEDAIYVFGADNISLHPKFFGSRVIDHLVYIPRTRPADLNSVVAAAMVLYDRGCKLQ